MMQCAAVRKTFGSMRLPVHSRSPPVTPSASKSNISAPTLPYDDPVGEPPTIKLGPFDDWRSSVGVATSPHAARIASESVAPSTPMRMKKLLSIWKEGGL